MSPVVTSVTVPSPLSTYASGAPSRSSPSCPVPAHGMTLPLLSQHVVCPVAGSSQPHPLRGPRSRAKPRRTDTSVLMLDATLHRSVVPGNPPGQPIPPRGSEVAITARPGRRESRAKISRQHLQAPDWELAHSSTGARSSYRARAHWYASNRCAAPVSPPSRSGTHAAEGARSPADARRSPGSSLPPADHFAVEVRRAGRGDEDGEGHGAEERLHRSAAGRQLRIEALRPVVREAVPLPVPGDV